MRELPTVPVIIQWWHSHKLYDVCKNLELNPPPHYHISDLPYANCENLRFNWKVKSIYKHDKTVWFVVNKWSLVQCRTKGGLPTYLPVVHLKNERMYLTVDISTRNTVADLGKLITSYYSFRYLCSRKVQFVKICKFCIFMVLGTDDHCGMSLTTGVGN